MIITPRGRGRTGVVLALLATLMSAAVVFAGSASAAPTVKSYYNGYLGPSHYLTGPRSQGPAKVGGYDVWTVQQISDSPSGHDRVFLHASGDANLCLDQHAATNGGAAWVISCNGGNYQIWEVFYESNHSRVFKGWGSWTQQSLHLCLSSSGNTAVIMATCNESASRQQWYGETAPGQ
ncbi:ricin-type beta-trefoil lectin domain protein [Kibdelosporangium lantanae]|uniref:Ricin-type beta-trefoil lectin domain protein n=1 Tax=Kibdelosporangium lantanae TaxID=1497396 RepID=A0ABW3M291_9PSEU